MSKETYTYYYIQEKSEIEGHHRIVYHSQDEETLEMYHLFLTKKSCLDFLKEYRKENPNKLYRVIKCTEVYTISEWS